MLLSPICYRTDSDLYSWEDSVMLAAHNARERSLDEYTNLFKAADAGFSFVGKSGGAAGVAGMFYSLLEYKFSKPS